MSIGIFFKPFQIEVQYFGSQKLTPILILEWDILYVITIFNFLLNSTNVLIIWTAWNIPFRSWVKFFDNIDFWNTAERSVNVNQFWELRFTVDWSRHLYQKFRIYMHDWTWTFSVILIFWWYKIRNFFIWLGAKFSYFSKDIFSGNIKIIIIINDKHMCFQKKFKLSLLYG